MDVLDHLFRRLVLAARTSGALERPITLGEVLYELAPYASAKREGGIDSHDDYLHALMRLASGERAVLGADDRMQNDLRAELNSPNPDFSVLRTYTQSKLTVSPEGSGKVLAGDTTIDLRSLTTDRAAAEPAMTPRFSEPPTEPRPQGTVMEAESADSVSANPGHRGCPYCAQALPDGRSVTFCPACGLNLLMNRCPGCSAEIESEWTFCITCGRKS